MLNFIIYSIYGDGHDCNASRHATDSIIVNMDGRSLGAFRFQTTRKSNPFLPVKPEIYNTILFGSDLSLDTLGKDILSDRMDASV